MYLNLAKVSHLIEMRSKMSYLLFQENVKKRVVVMVVVVFVKTVKENM